MDLYEILGVAKDATLNDITRAFRAKSKTDHPDAGGDPENFADLTRAYAILKDPKRRVMYDMTGKVDDSVDSERQKILSVVQSQLGKVINEFIASGFDRHLDPRRMDVMAKVRSMIDREIMQAEESLTMGRAAVDYLADMRSRFSGPIEEGEEENLISRGLAIQVVNADEQIKKLEGSIALHRAAMEMLATYSFRFDPNDRFLGGAFQSGERFGFNTTNTL